MQPIKRFLEANFRIKVLVPVVVVMSVLLLVMVWFVEHRARQQQELDAQDALKTYGTVFGQLQSIHRMNMRMRLETIAKVPKYNSVFIKGDFKSTMDQLARMYVEEQFADHTAKIAFVRFTAVNAPENTEPLIWPADNSGPLVAASAASVRNARSLHNDEEPLPETVYVEGTPAGKLYNIFSLRVYNPEHIQYGVLTFGEEINPEAVAQDYGTITRKPIVFMGNGHAVVSTFPDGADKSKFDAIYAQLAGQKEMKITVGNQHFFCTSGNFPSLNKASAPGYILFSQCDLPDSTVTTQKLLLAMVIIGIFVGSACVLFFINKATEPLRQLHDAAVAVGRGDFSQRVNIQSRDEFGELGHAFNQMTENIELSQSKLKQTVETLKTTQSQLIQSEKLSAVGEFVAGVAHELNNPLAAVMGFSEMLKDADVGEKHSRHLDMIFKSAQRCQKIVQSLLSFARRSAPERKPVSPNKLIEDVLEMIAYPLRTSNVKVITHFSPRLPLVLADGHQIQQVVLNIINNARQAIESAEGSGRITITTNADARCVRIIISDNGPGISAGNLKRIFDPFFTTKEVGKGTGLGLSLCYGMIREHGGNIIPSSQPGEGATFTIELPVAGDGAWFETSFTTTTATNGASRPNIREGAGKRILVVDDEESLLHMIKEELTQHHYDVTTAANGETALRTLREKKFDAIICDLKMPGINGRQVYERLREESPDTCRRMVFVTGDIIGDQLRNFLETEKRPCLTKPFSLGDLRAAVKELIVKG